MAGAVDTPGYHGHRLKSPPCHGLAMRSGQGGNIHMQGVLRASALARDIELECDWIVVTPAVKVLQVGSRECHRTGPPRPRVNDVV